jgi:hypothetical protein
MLISEFGAVCHACRLRPGIFVDHDHFSGIVRGLLCVHCNTHVDECAHASGCPWADYLNDPPAARMKIRYPKLAVLLRKHQRKIDYLGFDPFAHLRVRFRS